MMKKTIWFIMTAAIVSAGRNVALAQTAAPPQAAAIPAQSPAAPPTDPRAPAGTPPDVPSVTQKAVEQRIAALAAKLAITSAQQQDWAAFAQVMRDNAANTDALFAQRAQNAASMSAVDNMKSYADIARGYADNTQRLSTAFEAIYGKFSAEQKQTADVLFRQTPPPETKHARHRR